LSLGLLPLQWPLWLLRLWLLLLLLLLLLLRVVVRWLRTQESILPVGRFQGLAMLPGCF
jgi:hypothetical protein